MSDKKATYIEVHYDDGTAEIAKFDQAARIWKWLMDAQAFICLRGAQYTGPKFTDLNAEEVNELYKSRR